MTDLLLSPKATALVNKVFTIFYAICAGFDKQFENIERLNILKSQWILAFMENDIFEETQICNALKHYRAEPNLINCPPLGQFLSFCAKKENEVPDFEIAYRECCTKAHPQANREEWSHPVVYHSFVEMTSSNFRNKSEKESRKMYEHYYHFAFKLFKERKPLRSITKALEDKTSREDKWATLKKYGVLPEYAHLRSRDAAMPVIMDLLKSNKGLTKELPYDKSKRMQEDNN